MSSELTENNFEKFAEALAKTLRQNICLRWFIKEEKRIENELGKKMWWEWVTVAREKQGWGNLPWCVEQLAMTTVGAMHAGACTLLVLPPPAFPHFFPWETSLILWATLRRCWDQAMPWSNLLHTVWNSDFSGCALPWETPFTSSPYLIGRESPKACEKQTASSQHYPKAQTANFLK